MRGEVPIDVSGHGLAEAGTAQCRPGVGRSKVFVDIKLRSKQNQSVRRVPSLRCMRSYVFVYILR